MVLWILAHDWPMNRGRAFLFFIFATGLIPQAFLLWLFFGDAMFHAMLLGALALPPVLVGLWCGLYLSRLVPDKMLRRISVALLLLVAASAIIMPYIRFSSKRTDAPPSAGSHAASGRENRLNRQSLLKAPS